MQKSNRENRNSSFSLSVQYTKTQQPPRHMMTTSVCSFSHITTTTYIVVVVVAAFIDSNDATVCCVIDISVAKSFIIMNTKAAFFSSLPACLLACSRPHANRLSLLMSIYDRPDCLLLVSFPSLFLLFFLCSYYSFIHSICCILYCIRFWCLSGKDCLSALGFI